MKKKVYKTLRGAKRACKPYEYPKQTLPWSKKQGYICVRKAHWMSGYEPRKHEEEEEK